jgi:hypothetical protein
MENSLESEKSLPPQQGKTTRSGTRIPCEIPITLTWTESDRRFSVPCAIVLVNPQGCVARLRVPVVIGTCVKLEGLPVGSGVSATVVNCISLGEHERTWLLSLGLAEPGNVWGIPVPPSDWFATGGNPTRDVPRKS